MTRVALVWHMHQPFYRDPATGAFRLPWVRLHALKDYYGMVALLEEHPAIQVTFNLVPSLLVQIEAYAADAAREPALDIGLKPAETLTPAETLFALREFFHADRRRMIEPSPRYAELLELRGREVPHVLTPQLTRAFGVDALRDLQVWHKLAWVDPSVAGRDERVLALLARGRNFTEGDKAALRAVELEVVGAVIPAYRRAAARGQVELSASPFFHPILPLLCDTDVHRIRHPNAPLPARRFQYPQDALEQLVRARHAFERFFGQVPLGLWPSEGSVSDAVVPLAQQAGFTWMATDEEVLARTLGTTFTRDAHGQVDRPDLLYRPYAVHAGGAQIACAFRDRVLSDLIGFTYASWDAEAAADDFIARIVEAGRRYAAREGKGDPLVTIILDGENAWEHYEGGGRPFLRAFYRRLSAHPDLSTVTMREGCAEPSARLDGILPGSWIDADFSVWIGHADDRRAWSQLADARAVLEDAASSGEAAPEALEAAREALLVAEGSDWFWWYGDDRSSSHDREFDDLFRRYVRQAYSALGRPVPDELHASNITTGVRGAERSGPLGLFTPVLDGEETSYFEWIGAGRSETLQTAGAMHRAAAGPTVLGVVLFGFDRHALHVRVEGEEPMHRVLAAHTSVVLEFLAPRAVRVVIEARGAAVHAAVLERAEGRWTPREGPDAAVAAAGRLLECSVPLSLLRASTGSPSADAAFEGVRFFVTLWDAAGHEIERHPAHEPIEADLPGGAVESQHWRV